MIRATTITQQSIFNTPTSLASIIGDTLPITKLRVSFNNSDVLIGDSSVSNSPRKGYRLLPQLNGGLVEYEFEFDAVDDAINTLYLVGTENSSVLFIYIFVS